jgi:hypothetical protein
LCERFHIQGNYSSNDSHTDRGTYCNPADKYTLPGEATCRDNHLGTSFCGKSIRIPHESPTVGGAQGQAYTD